MNTTAPAADQTLQELCSQAVENLGRLLNLLYPDPGADILTLDDVKRRYPLTGKGPLAITAIEQAQRINRAIGNFEDMGLCEFQIGLIYLYWKDYRGAAQQFREARQQWSFVDKAASVCLAYFAEGLALHCTYAFEAALGLYGKSEHVLPRIQFDQSAKEKLLERELSQALLGAQKSARDKLWLATVTQSDGDQPAESAPTSGERTTESDTAVSPPTFPSFKEPLQFPSPIPSHSNSSDLHAWFRVPVQRKENFTDFRQQGWLLVNKQIKGHIFNKGDLIIVANDDQDANVILVPHTLDDQSIPRICLARAKFEGALTRDSYNVQLSTNIRQIAVSENEILGYVIGWWLEVGDSEIVENWS